MADLQLNKPLYKSNAADAPVENRPVPVKAARPTIMPRIGAVLVDVLLLHFAYLLIIKVAPGLVIRLGRAGEWIGLLGAWFYFAVCGSHLALGRTLGKLVMRLQVLDVAGPDLPFNRAALRATILLAGCVVTIALGQYADALEQTTELNPLPPFLATLGWAINVGWLLGLMLFAVYEPNARTLADRLAGSAVTASDADPTLLQDYLGNLRASANNPVPKWCFAALAISLVAACALVTPQYITYRNQLNALSASDREQLVRAQSLFRFPGFHGPSATGRFENASGDEDKASTAVAVLATILTYNQVGRIDIGALKQNPDVNSFHKRTVEAAHTQADFRESIGGLFNNLNLTRTRSEQPGTTIPRHIRMELSFAEKADLFFASDSVPKYSVSETFDLDPGDPATSRPLTITPRKQTSSVANVETTTAAATAISTISAINRATTDTTAASTTATQKM